MTRTTDTTTDTVAASVAGPTGAPVREVEPLPDDAVEVLRSLLAETTPGVWKLWGMVVLADQDGSGNVDNAVKVAATSGCDATGAPRTWNAKFIAEAHNLMPGLLGELDRLRAECAELRAAAAGVPADGAR